VKITWDIFLFLNTLVLFFYIPLTLSFEVIEDDKFKNSFNIFQFGIYLFDMCINLNTAYIDNGVLVKERKQICKQYLRGSFVLDFIAISSLVTKNDEFFGIQKTQKQNILLFQLLFFVRIKTFRARFNKIKEFFCLDSKLKGNFFHYFFKNFPLRNRNFRSLRVVSDLNIIFSFFCLSLSSVSRLLKSKDNMAHGLFD